MIDHTAKSSNLTTQLFDGLGKAFNAGVNQAADSTNEVLSGAGVTVTDPALPIENVSSPVPQALDRPQCDLANPPTTDCVNQLASLASIPVKLGAALASLESLLDAATLVAQQITRSLQALGVTVSDFSTSDSATTVETDSTAETDSTGGAESAGETGGTETTGATQSSPLPDAINNDLELLAKQSSALEKLLRGIIENSTYPTFNDFLKDMVEVAQKLRESATKAKMAAIESKFETMMKAAEKMLEAAEKAQKSREKQIEAEQSQAIGQIVAGVITAVAIAYTGYKGSKVPVTNAEGVKTGTKALEYMQYIGSPLGQGLGGVASGFAGIAASLQKAQSSDLQHDADVANVAKTELEAAAQLMDGAAQIADDLREIAKGLRDMLIKLRQDLANAQYQTIQRVTA